MGSLLRDIVVAIGALLGIIRAGDPAISLRVFRDAKVVYVNVEVANAFPSEARELLVAGNTLDLVLTLDATGHPLRRFSHGISYSPITEVYTVRLEETGGVHTTANQDVAIEIASRVYGLRLLDTASLSDRRGLDLTVSCALVAADMDASVVWNYRSPRAHASFGSLSEIPQ